MAAVKNVPVWEPYIGCENAVRTKTALLRRSFLLLCDPLLDTLLQNVER